MKTKLFLFTLLSIAFIGCQRLPTKEDTQKVDDDLKCAENYSFRKDSISEYYAKKALDLADSINYKKGIVNALNRRGTIYAWRQNYPMALDDFKKAINISNSIGFSDGIHSAEASIGVMYMDLRDYGMAMQYIRNSLKSKDERLRNINLTNLIECFVELYKNDTTSKHFLNSAFELATEFDKNMRNYSNPRLNGMPDYIFGIISFYENDKQRAWNHFENAEKIFTKNGNISYLGWNNIYKAKILKKNGDTNGCLSLLYTALSQGEETWNNIVSESSKLLSEEYEKIDTISAYKHLRRHVTIQDELNKSGTRIALNKEQERKSESDKKEERSKHIIKLAWISIICCLFYVLIFIIIKFFSDILPMIEKYKGYHFIQRITKWGKIVLKIVIPIIIFESVVLISHSFFKEVTNNNIEFMLVIFTIIGTSIFLLHHKLISFLEKYFKEKMENRESSDLA